MVTMYYDKDCNLGLLDGKTVNHHRHGNQGHAHAQNLKDSGVNVVVGLRKNSGVPAKSGSGRAEGSRGRRRSKSSKSS